MADEIQIEILADGTIKSETGKIAGTNHTAAEAFFKLLEEKTGGKATRTRRGKATAHAHHQRQQHTHN